MVICLMGPTASGKTSLAVELVKRFPFEIISVDSAMVYRGMDIGTAKPSTSILQEAPHHLINIREPNEAYSAGEFRRDALRLIDDIHARHRIPLLVGGTMLYFKVLQEGIADLPTSDPLIRDTILHRASEQGWPALHAALMQVDPDTAKRLNPNDSQRIGRALEVYEMTGKTLTEWQQNKPEVLPHSYLNMALIPTDRAWLHDQINQRVDQMLKDGLIEEVKRLMQFTDLSENFPSMRACGYRECWSYLRGELDYDTMLEKIKASTRQLAKRQLTWLRSWPSVKVFDPQCPQMIEQVFSFFRMNKVV